MRIERRNPAPLEAIQYVPGKPGLVRTWLAERGIEYSTTGDRKVRFRFQRSERQAPAWRASRTYDVYCDPGMWVVLGEMGGPAVYTAEEFEQLYRRRAT